MRDKPAFQWQTAIPIPNQEPQPTPDVAVPRKAPGNDEAMLSDLCGKLP
jgi:hypothetical protein